MRSYLTLLVTASDNSMTDSLKLAKVVMFVFYPGLITTV